MKLKKLIIIIGTIIIITSVIVLSHILSKVTLSAGDDASLRWTIIGAFGSWAGSIFGAVALAISLFALWLPQRVKMQVDVASGFMFSESPLLDSINAYVITVKNVGVRPVTVTNVYLRFGKKASSDIFIGKLNDGTELYDLTPRFPIRLGQGEQLDYYLQLEKFNRALAHYADKTPLNTPLIVRVDEVTKGTRYYKTKLTLGSFIGDPNE